MKDDQAKTLKHYWRQRGSTLILAMWSLLLLTTFAVQLGIIVRQKITLVRRLDNRDKRARIAEAGVKYAIAQLRKPDILFGADFLSEQWSDQRDLFEDRKVGQGSFTISHYFHDGENSRVMYGLEDEERKININKSDVDVLIRLLQNTAGLGRKESEELAYSIVDWRDNDSFFQHPQYGAEDSDYRGRQYSYEAKDSEFEVIEELLLVNKMDQEIFDKIRDFVTIYGEGKVNINTASKEVLLALGIRDYVAENILLFRRGGDLVSGTGDDDIFLQESTIVSRLSQTFDLSPSEVGSLSNLVAAGQFCVKSENFMIKSVARLGYLKGQTAIVAVSDRTGKIKYWREEI
jgi:type II secretory pathway component PulK